MLGLPLGLLYANAVEWVVHKYVLHGLGKRKGSFFAFHWSNHHKNARRFGNYDPDYEKSLLDWRSRGKEVGGIMAIMVVHAPLITVAPWFTAAVWYSGFNYLYKHEKSHLDVEWGKKHMRSHFDHHMGRNQDMNWCVTRPWFDWVMGTRERFVALPEAVRSGAFASPPEQQCDVPKHPSFGSAVGASQGTEAVPEPLEAAFQHTALQGLAANDATRAAARVPSVPPAA